MKFFFKIITLSSIALLCSCGGGDGDGDDGGPIVPPNNPPKAAALVFPIEDSECNEGTVVSDTESTVTFEWNDAEFADRYTVNLKNLNTNTTTNLNATGNTLDITILRGVPYSWSVTSKSNANVQTAESDTWNFYNAGAGVTNYAPFPADPVTPSIGGLTTSTVTLEWSGGDADNDTLEFDVYLSESNPPTDLHATTSSQKINDINLDAGKVYYWKVVSKDANNSTESQIFDFRTQ